MSDKPNRRQILTALGAGAASLALHPRATLAEATAKKGTAVATPLPRQVAWQDFEVGVIFHFDMPLFGERPWNSRDAIHKTWDPKRYNPEKLDTDQWLQAASDMGARYAIVTATHFNGFLQWQSDLYPYGVRQAAWRKGKGDLVKDFTASCRRRGIKPGVYLSCFRNAWWKVDRYRVHYGKGGPEQKRFARTCERMVEELCSRYGELCEIWFDAGLIAPDDGGPDVLPIVDKHQPNMVFYHSPQRREHRWIGNESGHAGYPCWATMPGMDTAEAAHKGRLPNARKLLLHGTPNGKLWSPAMVDTVLRNHHWFWKPNTERTLEPVERLVRFYTQSVGRNCNLMLGLTPDPSGLLPEPDAKRCAEFGKELRRRFAAPLAETDGKGEHVELALPKPARIDRVIVMEDIRHGERVREYAVEGLVPGNTWQNLCGGTCIGHKRIEQFAPVQVAKIRLRVTKSVAQPVIRKLAAYATA